MLALVIVLCLPWSLSNAYLGHSFLTSADTHPAAVAVHQSQGAVPDPPEPIQCQGFRSEFTKESSQ